MTIQQATIAKLQELPEPLVREVADFIDFLLVKRSPERWRAWSEFSEAQELANVGIAEYGRELDDYEQRLARGEIHW